MICPQYYPVIGGYEKLTHTLARSLNQAGVQCSVATKRAQRAWARHEVHEGVPMFRLVAMPKRGLDGPVWLLSLLFFLLLRRNTFDVYHVHDIGWSLVAARLVGWLYGKPVVAHPHAGSGATVRAVNGQWNAALVRWALRHAEAGIAFSDEMAGQLAALSMAAERIQRLPNTIDTGRFRPDPTQSRAGATVLYVGRLSEEKGVTVLLTAWPLVQQQLPAARLLLVGDGPQRAALETQAASLGIRESVTFVGAVQEGTERYYQQATLFVLASHREGVPIALLEALACGLPVVASRLPSVEQIVEEGVNGLLVPPGDHVALAETLVQGLARGDRDALGRAGRALVEQHYSLERVLGQYQGLYESLMQQRRGLKSALRF